jgi:hypothetical protein
MKTKIRFYKKINNNINNFYEFFDATPYNGMRSNILHGIDPNIPEQSMIMPKNNYYGEKPDIQKLALNCFPRDAFKNNLITYINAPAKVFEETINIVKIKWLISTDFDCALTALSYIYNNLQKGGCAIIICVTTEWENKGILEVLAHSFVTLKISEAFVIAEHFNEKYAQNMLCYVKYCFDSPHSIKLLK